MLGFISVAIWVALVSCIAGFFIHKAFTHSIPKSSYAPPAEFRVNSTRKRVIPEASAPTAFIDDLRVHGRWESVGFVDTIEAFDPARRQAQKDLYLQDLEFLPQGRMSRPWVVWSAGEVYHQGDKTTARYTIRTIEGEDYLFYEWMSGDVIFYGREPKYYVLVRATSE